MSGLGYVRFLSFIPADVSLSLCRYLIEGKNGAVLHTGDLRAELWFLENLKRNSFLQPYLSTSGGKRSDVIKPLEAIYLDTACVMNIEEVPTKVCISPSHYGLDSTKIGRCCRWPRRPHAASTRIDPLFY